jgi:hypothetical protein
MLNILHPATLTRPEAVLQLSGGVRWLILSIGENGDFLHTVDRF